MLAGAHNARWTNSRILRVVVCCVPVFFATSVLTAQQKAGVTQKPAIKAPQPIQLEDQWTTALVKRDQATFERLLAPGFVYTEDASVMSRGDVIKSVSGPDRIEWARNEGMKLHDFGDVHVVTGVLHLKGRGKDGAFDRRYQFTDTWQRRNGRWQIVAAQDYLVPR
jgi:hypothetical protein